MKQYRELQIKVVFGI